MPAARRLAQKRGSSSAARRRAAACQTYRLCTPRPAGSPAAAGGAAAPGSSPAGRAADAAVMLTPSRAICWCHRRSCASTSPMAAW